MTDYKALADRLVELGIGHHRINPKNGFDDYCLYESGGWMSAYGFCTDWRVAGKCMERMTTTDVLNHIGMTSDVTIKPLAIIQAYVDANND